MKRLRLLGLTIFLTAFTVFIAVFFLSDFKLTDEVVSENLDEKRVELIRKTDAFASLEDSLVANSFELNAKLTEVFKAANNSLLKNRGITPEMEAALLETPADQYDSARVAFVIPIDRERVRKDLTESTQWIMDQSYSSQDKFRAQLQSKIAEVNQRLIAASGFEQRYQKDLKFQLTRDAHAGFVIEHHRLLAWVCFVVTVFGALLMFIPRWFESDPPGIRNNHVHFKPMTTRGWSGIILGVFLIAFYILLYWWPEHMTSWVILLDPFSQWLKGTPASQWFLYGLLYTYAILIMGVRMFYKYRHNRYQFTRTGSVMFFQLFFAFLIPEILLRLNLPYMDFKNIWPLDYDLFFNGQFLDFNAFHAGGSAFVGGTASMYFLFWGVALAVIAVPVFSYFYGKRWYCSWVCGCGGLAETAGDPYRHLSDNSIGAWKVERWMVHGVLVFAVAMTGLTLYTFFSGSWNVFGIPTGTVQQVYGFMIGAAFAGVVGTGFYPFMGNRVWCRFGCPLAAYIGLVQRFKSRFRITTNGGQCISCGNCTVYCEMGIDVRWYAQRGQNIVRASCVGCGICAAVCPRGVLKLENGPEEGRINEDPILIGRDGPYLSHEITEQR